MEHIANQVTLRGTLAALPAFSHENHGKEFYRFTLEVPRLSGTVDALPVIAQAQVVNEIDLFGGDMLTVTGQIRSHNSRDADGRHLMIYVFASDITADSADPVNEIAVTGAICKEPVYRRTPLGREISDVMLAVPRAFRRADYLPCILWGRTAQEVSECHIRDQISIFGRLQSRMYTKMTPEGPQERTAYEISALRAEVIR